MPWRRSGVKYTNNEAYFDVIEEVDAIIDKNGSTVSAEIHGYVRKKLIWQIQLVLKKTKLSPPRFQIDCMVKLTGMPDLTMSFMNPRMFDDSSFHPCVRFKRWEVSTSLDVFNASSSVMGLLVLIAWIGRGDPQFRRSSS